MPHLLVVVIVVATVGPVGRAAVEIPPDRVERTYCVLVVVAAILVLLLR